MRKARTHEPSEPTSVKQPYRTPHLKVHGDFRKLTAAKGSRYNDGGGKPRTKQLFTSST
jgi:hypothetical protein